MTSMKYFQTFRVFLCWFQDHFRMLLLPLNPHTGHLYLHSNSELCWPSSQQTIHYFTLQVTRAKCLIFRSATHWLYSFPWDWAEPGSPLEQLLWSSPKPAGSWAWTIPALSQPPPSCWDHQDHHGCTTSPLWVLTVPVSLWKHWIVKCPPHISNSLSDCVPFYYPEYLLKIFGSRALRTKTVFYVPPWTKLFSIPAEQQRGYYFLHCLNCY